MSVEASIHIKSRVGRSRHLAKIVVSLFGSLLACQGCKSEGVSFSQEEVRKAQLHPHQVAQACKGGTEEISTPGESPPPIPGAGAPAPGRVLDLGETARRQVLSPLLQGIVRCRHPSPEGAWKDLGTPPSEEETEEETFQSFIVRTSRVHGVDPALVKAIIMVESACNPEAKAKDGATGLMQLMPATAEALGVVNAMDPVNNLTGGIRYLGHLLRVFDGDIRLTLAAYNAGIGRVKEYGGIPPFEVTYRYIDKVLAYFRHFKKNPGVVKVTG